MNYISLTLFFYFSSHISPQAARLFERVAVVFPFLKIFLQSNVFVPLRDSFTETDLSNAHTTLLIPQLSWFCASSPHI